MAAPVVHGGDTGSGRCSELESRYKIHHSHQTPPGSGVVARKYDEGRKRQTISCRVKMPSSPVTLEWKVKKKKMFFNYFCRRQILSCEMSSRSVTS